MTPYNKLTVTVRDELGRTFKKAFRGIWLIGDAAEGERFRFDESSVHDAGLQGELSVGVAVAHTQHDRLVVAHFKNQHEIGALQVFDDFESFASSKAPRFPESLIAIVADDLGIEHVQELVI